MQMSPWQNQPSSCGQTDGRRGCLSSLKSRRAQPDEQSCIPFGSCFPARKRRRPPWAAFEAGTQFPVTGRAQPVTQMESTDLRPWEMWCRVCRATGEGRGVVRGFWLGQGSSLFAVVSREIESVEEPLQKFTLETKLL